MREELVKIAATAVDMASDMGIRCEAFVQKKRHTSVSIEAGKVVFGMQDGDYGVGLRVISDNHTGYAFCTDKTIDFGLKQALASSKFGKYGHYSFHDNTRYNGTRSIFDNKVATMVTEDGIEIARDMIESAGFDERVTPSRGGVSFGTQSFAVANTNGVSIFDEGTFIGGHMMSIVREEGRMINGDESEVSRNRDFSFEDIGRKAGEKALAQLNQRGIETGAMDVILKPDAMFDIISNTIMPALYGDAVRKGESVYAGQTGKKIMSDGITIVDDATHPKGLNTYIMDEEGYPSQRNVIVDRGVLNMYLYDQFSASESKVKSTGSAMHAERMESGTSYKAIPTTSARNFLLEGDTMSEDELIRSVRNGVVIEHVLGAHTANKVSGDFSVAIYAGYAILDGEIVHPLKGGMIGGNLPQMLLNATLANNYRVVEAGMSPASGYIPSVKFENVRVSGG